MSLPIVVLFILEFLLACYLFRRAVPGLDFPLYAAFFLIIILSFALRFVCLDYETLDYINFLTRWVSYFKTHGGFAALSESVGNYNIPYLYFISLISYFDVSDLHLIKLFSILADIILAYAASRLVSLSGKKAVSSGFCFVCVMFLPTVVLNGSLWGQCDSVYAACALMSVVLALEGRPVPSVFAMTLSFGFKLQAVFIMPVIAVFLFTKKYKIRHLFLFPLFYVLLMLPAVIAGRPLTDTVMLYFNQAGSVGSALNYNSSSLFAALRNISNAELASGLGIAAAFVFMALVLVAAFLFRKRLSPSAVIAACFLLSAGIPFFLPHMHERYFFCGDVFSLILAFAYAECIPAALLMQFASLLGYYAYLNMRFLLPMRYGTAAMIVALVIGIAAFAWSAAGPGSKAHGNTGELVSMPPDS